jgi:hypothetical protein
LPQEIDGKAFDVAFNYPDVQIDINGVKVTGNSSLSILSLTTFANILYATVKLTPAEASSKCFKRINFLLVRSCCFAKVFTSNEVVG